MTSYSPPPGSIPTLNVPTLDGVRRVHMVGIGGAGMSGIARLLLARGIAVSGSDLKDSRGLEDLRQAGAVVSVGHRAQQIGEADAVGVSTAIPDSNAEVRAALERGIPVYARAQLLAALAKGRRTIAVSGTHGKTTTTSMLAVILERAGVDPSFVIGGDLNESGSGARHGDGPVFVAEADESDGSFLLLSPEVAVVTNVEADHLDFYRGGENEIRAAFSAFLNSAERSLVCGDDTGARAALADSKAAAVTYGVGSENDVKVVASPAEGSESGGGSVALPDGSVVSFSLQLPGVHNVLNAAAALLAAELAGVEPGLAAASLATFTGVRRRFEYRGEAGGARFVDDYAHHPTEVAATVAASREGEARRVLAVFQPHRYTRTQALWEPLGRSLAGADVVVVTDVYGAGEQPIPGVTGKLLVDALTEGSPGKRVVYLPHRTDLAPFLASEVSEGDLVLTLGAGDITMVADETIERMRDPA